MSKNLETDSIEERFFIHGRMEILQVVNELLYRSQPVVIHLDDKENGFAIHLLEARGSTLIFASSQDPHTNQRLLASNRQVFVSYPDGICVQFSTNKVTPVLWGEHHAMSVLLPHRVARVQRQESYRLVLPVQSAVVAELFDCAGSSLGQWPLHDVSVGGVGLSMPLQSDLAIGPAIDRLRLILPTHGEIDANVILQHTTDLAQSGDCSGYRMGLAFSGLAAAMRTAIQRYIIEVEHERRNQSSPLDVTDE